MSVEIIWEPRGVWRKFSGRLTAEEFIKSIEVVHNDWRFDDLCYSLNDFLAVDDIEIVDSAVKTAAVRAVGASMSNTRLMMAVVTRDPRIISLASVFLTPLYKSYPIRFFNSIDEARQWLDHV